MSDVPRHRSERLSDRIKRAWRSTERFGPFILVGLAFLLQTIGLTFAQPTATQVATILLSLGLLLIFAVVSDIHTHLFKPEKERGYLDFDAIVPEIQEHLRLAAKSQNRIEIKMIGLTLANQWKVVENFLREIAAQSADVKVDFHIVHLDPDWEELQERNPRMPIMVQAVLTTVDDFCSDFAAALGPRGSWSIHRYPIREFPVVAGMLIDRSKLFRTLCDADHGKMMQGQRMYEFFEFRDPGRKHDQDSVNHFERIFQFYTTRYAPSEHAGLPSGDGRRSAEAAQVR